MCRRLPIVLALAAFGTLVGPSWAQEQNPTPSQQDIALKRFQGTASQTTPAFQVGDSWEVRWSGTFTVNVTVLAQDGTVVGGAAGAHGAVYFPKGGTYHLQIDYSVPPQFRNPNSQPQNQGQGPGQATPFGTITDNGPSSNSNPSNGTPGRPFVPPSFMAGMNRPYDVEVVLMSAVAASATADQGASLSNMLPNFTLPPGVMAGGPASPVPVAGAQPAVAPAAPVAVTGTLSQDQARAVVLIKGDEAEGTGFLVKTPDGPVVITNIHVLANNPNIKITTNTGSLVTVLSQKCAADRDLAMLSIKDFGYSYLEMAPDISKVVQPGDPVVTPGNSEGGEVMLNTQGTVLGVGPERVEISNPIYHGNSGGPVFHPKSGKVLGVVTEAEKVDLSDDLDKTSFASRNSAISGQMRYFALRLDTVTEWIPVDTRSFTVETQFLDQFEEQSERLDAYLNRNANGGSSSDGGDDKSKIYLNDEKIMRAENNYQGTASDSDTEQHLEALRSLLFDLQGVADSNYDKIQDMNNFYPFDRERARDEMAYRKALKAELDAIGNNIDRLGHLPRTNN